MIQTNKPVLAGKRIILRELSLSDAKQLSQQGNDKKIHFFMEYIKYPFTLNEAKKLIKNRLTDARKNRTIYEFAIIQKQDNALMGLISLHHIDFENKKTMIGYWLGEKYRGMGYASEALPLIIEFAFNKLKLNKICADTLVSNKKSNHLLKKFGFRKIGIKKEHKFYDQRFYDKYGWELLRKR